MVDPILGAEILGELKAIRHLLERTVAGQASVPPLVEQTLVADRQPAFANDRLKTYLKDHSQTELARVLGVTQGAVWQWANGQTAVKAERCPTIERVTDRMVRCEDLRPDVEWGVLRQAQPAQQPTGQRV